jgi:hypothetical protein
MAGERWYYLDDDTATGPFGWSRLIELSKAELIGPKTFVWQEGSEHWLPLGEAIRSVVRLQPPAPPPIRLPQEEDQPPPLPFTPTTVGSASEPAPLDVDPDLPFAALQREMVQSDHGALAYGQDILRVDTRGWSSEPVAPWRRYAARMLDTSVNGLGGVLLLAYIWYSIAPLSADQFFSIFRSPAGAALDAILSSIIAAAVSGVIVGVTGSTIGKAIFGVKVLSSDLRVIGAGAGLSREFLVWVKGLGFGIPILALFTMYLSYNKLIKTGSTSWDEGSYIVLHRPNGYLQYGLNALGCILFFLVVAVIQIL